MRVCCFKSGPVWNQGESWYIWIAGWEGLIDEEAGLGGASRSKQRLWGRGRGIGDSGCNLGVWLRTQTEKPFQGQHKIGFTLA